MDFPGGYLKIIWNFLKGVTQLCGKSRGLSCFVWNFQG